MRAEIIQPRGWPRALGYSYGVKVSGGELLFIAGQVPKDAEGRLVGLDNLVAQFDQVLANLMVVLREAGGDVRDLTMLRIAVTDLDAYREQLREIGEVYRSHLGKHFPAMTLVAVKGLIEEEQLVEIEGMAVIPVDLEARGESRQMHG